MGFSDSMNGMSTFGTLFIAIVFIIVISTFIFVIGKSITTWSKNNNSPKLTVPAHIVTKRTETSGGAGDSSANTWYYVTFEVQSGDRMELPLRGHEFGQLAEGDKGLLTFQGTRYINFERKIEPRTS
ncbi:DUF2500 domain-containing protein [Chryseomicrobium palamuruense]|uniref:DUF2500 domain-containing protein n=1 Tax=Chryseomicrobium palamuruense TaxID=682973 RepID=A0ABV8URM7_9BACL